MRPIRRISGAASAVAALSIPLTLHAQAPTAGSAGLAPPPPPAAAPDDVARSAQPAPPPFTAEWNNGFALQSVDGNFRLAFGMVAQTDGRFSLDDPPPITNTFSIRKVRPTLSGRVGRYFDFKVMPDLGNGTTVVQDAYFDVRFSPKLRVRTGKDKTPVGYELLIGDAYLLFPERALASSLVPNRDIGVQVQGDLDGGRVFYAGGLFNGIPDGSSTATEVDTNGSKDFAGRIVVQPFRSPQSPGVWSGLGVQVGGSTGRQRGALPSFKTSVGQTYFGYATGAAADGVRNRLSPAVFYYYKAFGAFGEYMRSSQPVAGAGIATDVTTTAWEVTASYLLTGEAAGDRGVTPRSAFDPSTGRWGALQLLARYSELRVDRAVFAASLASPTASQKAQSFTVAANWYPVSFIKYYATFERTTFSGGNAVRPPENVILFRTQLAF
jgi:phosphate-selective porin OprO/OprP